VIAMIAWGAVAVGSLHPGVEDAMAWKVSYFGSHPVHQQGSNQSVSSSAATTEWTARPQSRSGYAVPRCQPTGSQAARTSSGDRVAARDWSTKRRSVMCCSSTRARSAFSAASSSGIKRNFHRPLSR
jgi:hypothetical protein